MARIRIVTDVAAYVRPELVERYKITVLPMEIRFGDERFTIEPGSDQERLRLFARMGSGGVKPAEALLLSSVLEKAFDRLSREADELLFVLSSGKLSNAVGRTLAASRAYMGRCRITIMDSMSSSWGLGLVVEAAAKAAAEGAPLEAVVRLVRGLLPHIYTVFYVERLDYLESKGRVGPAQALLGTMLRVRPVLLMEEGEIVPVEKVRTREQANGKLADFCGEFAAVEKVVILHSPLDHGSELQVAELRRLLGIILPRRHFPAIEYDPVLACHLGPQAMGVIVYERR